MWGGRRPNRHRDDVLAEWRRWATDVRGRALDCGHCLPEEAPDDTCAALVEFLTAPD